MHDSNSPLIVVDPILRSTALVTVGQSATWFETSNLSCFKSTPRLVQCLNLTMFKLRAFEM